MYGMCALDTDLWQV